MPKLKLTPEQKEQLGQIVAQMPLFPRTEPSGKPLQTWSIFRGSFLIKHYGDLKLRGYSLMKFKEIDAKAMYKVPSLILREPKELALKAMREGNVSDVIKKYYAEYTQYLKYQQSNGHKIDDTKSAE